MLARLFGLLPAAPRPAPPPLPVAREPRVAHADSLRLLFPPPGAVLGAALSGEATRVVLRAMGGQRPLTFLVDGAPLATDPARRDAAWRPTAPGFYRLTVLDASGSTAHANVRVKETR
jgi:penicillin-binding protein 1C